MGVTRKDVFLYLLIATTVCVLWMTFVTKRDHGGLDKVSVPVTSTVPPAELIPAATLER